MKVGTEWSPLRQAYQALIEKHEQLEFLYKERPHHFNGLTIEDTIKTKQNQVRALQAELEDLIEQRNEILDSIKRVHDSITEVFNLLPKEEQMDLIQQRLTEGDESGS